jgi:hypothetical protein
MYLWIARGLSHPPGPDNRLVRAQEAFFRRLGIKWLSGPDPNQPANDQDT